MRRKFSLLLAIAAMMSFFAGCQQNPTKGGFTLYEPGISEDVKTDIRKLYYEDVSTLMEDAEHRIKQKDWVWDYTKDGITYTAGCRYYGTFGDCIVWHKDFIKDDRDTTRKIVGCTFENPNPFMLYVYCNGAQYSLEDAYAQRLITAEDIATVAERHAAYNTALADGKILLDPSVTDDPLWLSEKQKQDIRNAYAAAYPNVFIAEMGVRTVWRSGSLYALYIDGGVHNDMGYTLTLEKDAKCYEFSFPDSQELYIYKAGKLCTLQQAYDTGVLNAEHLESLLENNAYKNDIVAYWYS